MLVKVVSWGIIKKRNGRLYFFSFNQEPYISRGLVAKFSVARSVGPILELLKVVWYEIENVFVDLLDIF